MYYDVASKLAVTSTAQFSQAVSMAGANAAQVNATVFNVTTGGTLVLQLQEGNDLENWSDITPGGSLTLGYGTLRATSIASQYVRLKYSATGVSNPTAIVATGINTASL